MKGGKRDCPLTGKRSPPARAGAQPIARKAPFPPHLERSVVGAGNVVRWRNFRPVPETMCRWSWRCGRGRMRGAGAANVRSQSRGLRQRNGCILWEPCAGELLHVLRCKVPGL
ncbi:hypothetical protein chiPu_0015307 [Chiloscyllium punctatum]|uniref:Uncharacterized protein n=1 Tax=Chiloscyllium punctatum TaxID=137246 RepID=A0A401T2J8_CHIPU|nr:hypothetical protein [Chiloscyllium punctatum]